jgi:hypothetical protein
LKGGKTSNSNKKLRLNQRYVKKLGTKLKEKKSVQLLFHMRLGLRKARRVWVMPLMPSN